MEEQKAPLPLMVAGFTSIFGILFVFVYANCKKEREEYRLNQIFSNQIRRDMEQQRYIKSLGADFFMDLAMNNLQQTHYE